MARTYVCDRCNSAMGQKDFDLITIYQDEPNGRQRSKHKLELCPQCGVEFREWYRFAWAKDKTSTPVAIIRALEVDNA